MATKLQRKKIAWPPGLLERKKQQQQQSRVFSDIIFDVYTHMDDRGRAKASENKGDEFRWKKNIKIS